MSLAVTPGDCISFGRPFTETIRNNTITLTNHNAKPVVFKIKTSAPSCYFASPNMGRIEPGERLDIHVRKQVMAEEPKPSDECQDKYLIQSVMVDPGLDMAVWNNPRFWTHAANSDELYDKKLPVAYTYRTEPPEKQIVHLSPSPFIPFDGPFTQSSQSTLTITNINTQPVAFKVKTNVPRGFCVCPNMGRLAVGETREIMLYRQKFATEPNPEEILAFEHKFLIQSVVAPHEGRTAVPVEDLFRAPKGGREGGPKIYAHKLRASHATTTRDDDDEKAESAPVIRSDSVLRMIRRMITVVHETEEVRMMKAGMRNSKELPVLNVGVVA